MKKMCLICISAILIIVLTSCSQNPLEVYNEAVIKTETIKYAKAKTEIDIQIELADELPDEVEQIRDSLKHIVYTNDTMFDKKADKNITRQFMELNGFGIDTVFYRNEGEEILKVPFLGKFIKMDELELFNTEKFPEADFEKNPISEETVNQISAMWFDLVNEEDVNSLGNEVVDTPEGEVKVQKLVVTFKDNQLKQFLNDVLDIIEKDEMFKTELLNYPIYGMNEDGEFNVLDDFQNEDAIEEIFNYYRIFIDSMEFNEFVITTYIDIDEYIVNMEIKMDVIFNGEITKFIKSIKFESFYQLYDIGEKIKFKFPKLNEDNTTTSFK
jgi:hypothetical protein